MKFSKATRAAAIEALLDVAAERQRWHPRKPEPLVMDFASGEAWALAIAAKRIVRIADGGGFANVVDSARLYAAAASLLDAGWSPP